MFCVLEENVNRVMFAFSNQDIVDDDGKALGNIENTNPQCLDAVLVKEVRCNSPTDKAGFGQGDRILSVNNQSIYEKTYSKIIDLVHNVFVSKQEKKQD